MDSSPWGKGFPGWPFGMSRNESQILGEQFDIPAEVWIWNFRPECEIAKANRQWRRSGSLLDARQYADTHGKKWASPRQSSVATRNIQRQQRQIEQSLFACRRAFLYVTSTFRNILDLSEGALQAAEKGYKRLMEAIKLPDELPVSDTTSFNAEKLIDSFYEAMNDDFNTPVLIANLFEAVKHINLINATKKKYGKR